MSEYYVHLALLVAIVLLGIEAAVILVRNNTTWLMMLLVAVAFYGFSMLAEGDDSAFAWLDTESAQAQFFELGWGAKASTLVSRSWSYIFALAAPVAAFYGRKPGKAKKVERKRVG